jgi:hypothetical protein
MTPQLSQLEQAAHQCSTPGGFAHTQVLPLQQAVQQAHISKFDEKREVVGARTMGRLTNAALDEAKAAADSPKWRECVATYPATGQQFRWGRECHV